MDQIINWLTWAVANFSAVLHAVVGVLVAMIALFMLIPGDQPEKALQGAVDFLKKFSAK